MFGFKFRNVCIESYGVHLPEMEVLSSQMEERLAPLYDRLGIPFGTLEKLSGVRSRYFWEKGTLPSQVASQAGLAALKASKVARELVKAVFSCSITRDSFEPATACMVHENLSLPKGSLVLDISNACLGFMNGIVLMGNLIESGIVKAGLVVSGETVEKPMEYCIHHILTQTDLARDDLIKLLPTFTLGSGAAAFLLTHSSLSPNAPRVVGGVSYSATQFNDLCVGNGDYVATQSGDITPIMTTDSAKLIGSAAIVGGQTWEQTSELLGWSRHDVDHIFCHQVGKQLNASNAFFDELKLDIGKQHSIYSKYGNLASAALPAAFVLGVNERKITKGEKILLTGFGSGINTTFIGLEW